MAWLSRILAAVWAAFFPPPTPTPTAPAATIPMPQEPATTPDQGDGTNTGTVPDTVPAPAALDWSTQKGAYHAARVICDQVGLSYIKTIPVYLSGRLVGRFAMKDILVACVFQESRLRSRYADGTPVENSNKDRVTGEVWSTDWGIVQVNDYYNIGPGKPFASVVFVLDNPEACIRWMAEIYKTTGALKPWASFTSNAFAQWLVPTSPLWALQG